MARKKRTPEENARREKIRELLQMANIGSMDDIQSLFKETIAEFMENGLDAELDDELGYSRYDYKNKDTDGLLLHSGGSAARRHGFNRSAPRGVTICYLASQVGAFAAAFLCCTFLLPAACKFSFCQVRFGA